MTTIKQFLVIAALLISCYGTQAQAPAIQWQKAFGGSNADNAFCTQQTSDGGYIIAGYAYSTDGDVTGNKGFNDFWVLKFNGTGVLQWQKTLGGSFIDEAKSIQQTNDGGFIVAGVTKSTNGDVTGNHGNQDYWVVKLNSIGVLQWQKSLGGIRDDVATSIRQVSDGGYIIAGYTASTDGDVTGNHGGTDSWIVKLNSTGVLQWQKALGGSNTDVANDIQQTSDGGYIVAGATKSIDGDVTGNRGIYDYWLVKINSTGVLQWQTTLGGSNNDFAYSTQQTSDGGYIVAGYTLSTDGQVTGNHGGKDSWVVKLNSTGVLQWQKTLGGSSVDQAFSIQQTSDGGYIVAGDTESTNGDVAGNHGGGDYWVVKLNNTGVLHWQKTLGGNTSDVAYSIRQTSDGGYIVAGYSNSLNGDITGNHGNYDTWVVKIAAGCIPTNSIFTTSACDSLVWRGKTYKTTGSYRDTLPNAAGCDSIITLNLTIKKPTSSDTTAIACNNFTWRGIVYITSGNKVFTTTNAAGCDSTITLRLTIKKSSSSDTSASTCTNFTWKGIVYNTSGDKVFTTTNAAGCDSTVTLHLTIKTPTSSDTTAGACASFTWKGIVYNTSGDKLFTTTNSAGCDSIVILHLTIGVTGTFTKINAGCYGTATGSITATPTNGVPPYQYKLNSGVYGSSNSFSNLKAGSYKVYIMGSNGCTTVSPTITLTQLPSVTGSATAVNAGCYGTATGSVTVTPATGTAPFTYRIGTTVSYVSSNTFSNQKAGIYTIYIKDANGCIGSVKDTILQQPAITGTFTKTDVIPCYGGANGSLTVTPTGGVAPFQYKLNVGGIYGSSSTFSGLRAGTYKVYVKDANGCEGIITVVISQPTSVAVGVTKTDISCTTPTGSITINAPNSPGATFRLTPSNVYSLQSSFNGLATGTYYGYAKDTHGCIGRSIAVVLSPAMGCRSTLAKGTHTSDKASSTSMSVTLSPNPNRNVFRLRVHTAKAEAIQLRVLDINGKAVYTSKGSPSQAFTFGEDLTAGIYMIEVRQGNEIKILKAIKMK